MLNLSAMCEGVPEGVYFEPELDGLLVVEGGHIPSYLYLVHIGRCLDGVNRRSLLHVDSVYSQNLGTPAFHGAHLWVAREIWGFGLIDGSQFYCITCATPTRRLARPGYLSTYPARPGSRLIP